MNAAGSPPRAGSTTIALGSFAARACRQQHGNHQRDEEPAELRSKLSNFLFIPAMLLYCAIDVSQFTSRRF